MNRQQLIAQALAALLANGYEDATSESLFTTHRVQFAAYLEQVGKCAFELAIEVAQ